MIKVAELLFNASDADKPTVLVLIDRNELEDQMLLAMLGIGNIQHADRIATLNTYTGRQTRRGSIEHSRRRGGTENGSRIRSPEA